jgi:hypothetical protein
MNTEADLNNTQKSDLLRYALWLAVAETAFENRQEYHMTTTWLPHLLTNSLALLLPEAFRIVTPPADAIDAANGAHPSDVEMIGQTVVTMVRDNPAWVGYVTPLALGYILSHPRFNIYKGKMGDLRVAGLGLDALPHGATAYGLVALSADTVAAAEQVVPRRNRFAPLIRWAARHPSIFTGLVLALVTLVWEYSEYRVHKHELRQKGGDITRINMQWSMADTVRDCVANGLGWAAAMVVRRLR